MTLRLRGCWALAQAPGAEIPGEAFVRQTRLGVRSRAACARNFSSRSCRCVSRAHGQDNFVAEFLTMSERLRKLESWQVLHFCVACVSAVRKY